MSSGVPTATTRPPRFPPSGPEIDHPIGRLDHVEIVFDDHDASARLNQPAKRRQQLADVVEVQASSRFVEDVENPRLPPVALGLRTAEVALLGLKMRRQLHALRLAAR